MSVPFGTTWFVYHLPHIVPAMLVFIGIGWAYYRSLIEPPPGTPDRDRWFAELDERRRERRRRPVNGGVARRALLALGPLLAAVGTGAVIYGIDLAGDRPSASVAWLHAGISTLACLLIAYKLAEVGAKRIRDGLRPGLALETAMSLLLAVLLIPLLLTGIALLVAPSSGSFAAYAHLIAAAWWTVLLGVHLSRYLRRSWRATVHAPAHNQPVPRGL
jgi:hypothetical protein